MFEEEEIEIQYSLGRKQYSINRTEKICLVCGKTYMGVKNQIYCSKECGQPKKTAEQTICITCGKPFPSYYGKRYCSYECKSLPRTKLNLAKPQNREYFLEKYNFKCTECDNIGTQLHHIKPLYKGGEDTEDNITLLCMECHRKKHFSI